VVRDKPRYSICLDSLQYLWFIIITGIIQWHSPIVIAIKLPRSYGVAPPSIIIVKATWNKSL